MRGVIPATALFLVACYLFALSDAPSASAASYVVDLTSGTSTSNACTAAASDCSIRGAINRANDTSTPGDIITFSPTVFPPGAPATITISAVLPSLLGGNDTIDGTGAGVIIDGSSEPSNFNCLSLDSDNNVVKNIQVTDCSAGVQVLTNRTGNTVGPGIVAFDNTSGISVIGDSNTVIGNKLGTNAAGTAVHPSGGNITDGITTLGDNITIGSANAADRNIISGNGSQGIRIQAGSNGVVIKGNYIGVDVNGTADVGNTGTGITVLASGNTIGGTAAGEGNVISGNNLHGISISGTTAGSNTIKGNLIGTDLTGTADVGNTSDGINISASPSNTIGGDFTNGGSNVISGNNSDGIEITGTGANGNQVTANYIGTTTTLSSRPNNTHGIRIAMAAANNTIGGNNSALNYIAFNGSDGVAVLAGTGNAIGFNSTFSNGGLGIDLGPDGVTPNDAAPDNDSGANNLQNFPVLTLASYSLSGDLTIQGTFTSAFDTTYTLRFYHSASCDLPAGAGNGEGETMLMSQSLATDAAGNVALTVTVVGGVPQGRYITATASDPSGNTSEFSNCLEARPITVNSTADPGDGVCNSAQCTLREAITAANSIAGSDLIEFRIGSGPQTVSLASPLPAITGTATLNATTQPGFTGPPLIELNGSSAGAGADGLSITAPGSTVRGLVVNRFSGNGIILQNGANNTIVEGNYIGVSAAGTADLGNAQHGLSVLSPGNSIGSVGAGAGNVISGNNSHGIAIEGSAAAGNVIQGNFIGTNAAGTADLGNTDAGISVQGAYSTVIGGTSASARNVISGNDGDGVKTVGTARDRVEGNFIGTDAAGVGAIPNSGSGVLVDGGSRNTIGGTTAGVRNVISGNATHGISVLAAQPIPVQEISTDVPKVIPDVATISSLIAVSDSATITDVDVNVTITHTFDADLHISLLPPSGPAIELSTDNGGSGDNYTNTTFDDEAAVSITAGAPPFTGAFRPEGSLAALDGTQTAGTWRLRVTDDSGGQVGTLNAWSLLFTTPGNKIQGNYIGTNANADAALANGADGIYIEGDANTIGGNTIGAANTIAFNAGAGVRIGSGIRNSYQQNSIHSNSGLGIDLAPSGVTANDPGDADSGVNQLQNFPELTSATSNGIDLTIAGRLDSTASTGFHVLVYSSPSCDPAANGEGQTYLGSFSVTTSGSGIATFSQTLPVVVSQGHVITATAADPAGNTSEFSGCVPVGLDTDGDSFGSFLAGFPLFSDDRELQLGTNPGIACAATATPDDESIDPYPLDTDDNGFTDITDVVALTGRFGETQTPSNVRYDFNLDGFIDISDIVYITTRFGEPCIPP